MNIIADLHTHTLASSHAFSTLEEMMARARQLGYKAMAVTDHGPAMPDSPHIWYFHNIRHLPGRAENGLILLKGIEANVVNEAGELDVEEELLRDLDWVIVSMHAKCIPPLGYEEATALWLKVAENPLVDMIGHSEEKRWLYDYDRVVPVFAKNHKVVELNANSHVVRKGGEENMRRLILACKQYGAKVAVNSDAHSSFNMGQLDHILALLSELSFPEELVVNSSPQRLGEELRLHGRKAAALFLQES